jgi:hypothetical protein
MSIPLVQKIKIIILWCHNIARIRLICLIRLWNEHWRGWWGENPPFHTPVIVLTHHARAPIAMAGGMDVRLGGGVAMVQPGQMNTEWLYRNFQRQI